MRPVFMLTCLVAAIVLALASIGVGTAAAREIHTYSGSSFGPEGTTGSATFANLQGVAVDQSTGNVYAFDPGAGSLYKFDESGEPSDFSSAGTNVIESGGGGGTGENEIAVAPAGAPGGTAGDIYIANNSTVKVFDSSGAQLGTFGEGETCGVAVDPEGHIFVGSYSDTVREYTPTGNSPSDFILTATGTAPVSLCNVGADGLGDVYAASYYGGQVAKLKGLGDPNPVSIQPGGPTLAVDPESNELFVHRGEEVARYAPSGALRETFGAGVLAGSRGIAVKASTGDVYVGNGSEKISIFERVVLPPAAPMISRLAARAVTADEATLSATIDPGFAPTTYHFEYLPEEAFLSEGGFASPQTARTPETAVALTEEAEAVHVSVNGLTPGITYRFRVVATNTAPGNPIVSSQSKSFFTYANAGPEEEQNCSNEQLRSENNSLALPDCRAYEQVTPSYKQSHGIYDGSGAIAPDGSSVISASYGAFAGTEDLPRGPGSYLGAANYRFDRTATGWETTALNPSAADILADGGSNSAFLPTVDAKELAYFLETTNPGVDEAYLREADGTLRLLGPLQNPATAGGSAAPYEMTGASADDSIITFEPCGSCIHWPGDTSAPFHSATLAIDGSSEPKLVGVTNTGPLHSNSEADPISDCGIGLASTHETKPNAISASGEFVYLSVPEVNPNQCTFGPQVQELYVRVNLEKTIAISQPILPAGEECTGACAAAAPQPAEFQAATKDGRKVFFTTAQPLLNADHDETTDLYEAEITGDGTAATIGKLTLVSRGGTGDTTPGEGANALGVLAFSRSGSRLYFAAEGSLTSTPNAFGQVPQAGLPNIYSYDSSSGATTFIATLEPFDSGAWEGGGGSYAQTTSDGRFLVFNSYGDLTPDDTSAARQLFEYDSTTKDLVRVSVGDRGYNNNGNTDVDDAYLGLWVEGRPSVSIADDGAVFFQSTAALTPGATNDPEHLRRNIYEFQDGRVSLIAPGSGVNNGSSEPNQSATRLWGIDESGENVFFTTLAQLTPTDVDGRPDLYTAHVGGGFPAPSVPANCAASGSCQGAASPPPGFTPPASATFSGPANKKPAQQKKKHHKHKKNSKKKQQKKKQHGGSSKQRRVGK